MRTTAMDNNLFTGKPQLDLIILAASWILIIAGKILVYMNLNIGDVSMILGCMASLFVIASKAMEIYDRRKNNRKKR
jgi:hypothetical protein